MCHEWSGFHRKKNIYDEVGYWNSMWATKISIWGAHMATRVFVRILAPVPLPCISVKTITFVVGGNMHSIWLVTECPDHTDIAPPLSPSLEKSVHPLFCDNISIFDWLQTTADIPTSTLPCPVCQRTKKHVLTPLPIVHRNNPQSDRHLSEDADCQSYNDYAINPIGARIISLKCLWNHILFPRIIVHKK